ncbi:MAG: DUF305 domain-containing protein [Ilumatobacter sp.]|uniref:DUF305 domain-containing protein n=1 Tax=Ilumatobacter sp. TaxID=1967498 RepID=UPI003298DF50
MTVVAHDEHAVDVVAAPTGATASSGPDPDEQVVSDALTERLFRVILGFVVAALLAGAFGAAAVWALDGDEPVEQPMNAVDVGFLRDMLDHHEQALLISNIYLDERPDSDVAPYAREVLLYQQREIEWMNEWLAEEGHSVGEPDRTAMEWMDEPVPVSEMPGMQSQERLDQLDAATGEAADRLFFRMMGEHHLGGVHMGDHAALNGARQEIMDFAASVSRNQRIEIAEYQSAYARLGLG